MDIWARRCISIPLYLTIFGLALLGAPFWLPILVTWDILRGDGARRPRVRCGLFLVLYLFCEAWGLGAAFLLWLVTLGGNAVDGDRYQAWHFRLQGIWAAFIFQGAKQLFSVKVEVDGQELIQPSPFILFVRHTSLADTVLAATFVSNPGKIGLRYVLKRELLWDPCLDVVGRRLPNHFLDRTGKRSDREVESVTALTRDLKEGQGVLIYPEGTRFSSSKRERALNRLREKAEPHILQLAESMKSVLPPRPRGCLALCDAAPQCDILVLSHTGFEGAARWSDFWSGSLIGRTLHVRLSRIPRNEIPTEGRIEWLYQTWAEVDLWVKSRHQRTEVPA